MNYYEARQRTDSDPPAWDFTCFNRRAGTHPEGYCRSKVPCPNWSMDAPFQRCESDCDLCHGEQFVPNPEHCGGHPTREAAEECFANYLKAQETRERTSSGWLSCEAPGDGEDGKCGAPTKRTLASTHPLGHSIDLCDEHWDKALFLASAPTRIGQITASY